VTFSATAVGTGQIVAAADGIQAKASITVSPKKGR
jgi:hypothetical protein